MENSSEFLDFLREHKCEFVGLLEFTDLQEAEIAISHTKAAATLLKPILFPLYPIDSLDKFIDALLKIKINKDNVHSATNARTFMILMKKIMDDIKKGAVEKASSELDSILQNGNFFVKGPVSSTAHFSETISVLMSQGKKEKQTPSSDPWNWKKLEDLRNRLVIFFSYFSF